MNASSCEESAIRSVRNVIVSESLFTIRVSLLDQTVVVTLQRTDLTVAVTLHRDPIRVTVVGTCCGTVTRRILTSYCVTVASPIGFRQAVVFAVMVVSQRGLQKPGEMCWGLVTLWWGGASPHRGGKQANILFGHGIWGTDM